MNKIYRKIAVNNILYIIENGRVHMVKSHMVNLSIENKLNFRKGE